MFIRPLGHDARVGAAPVACTLGKAKRQGTSQQPGQSHRFDAPGGEWPVYEPGTEISTRKAYGEALAALGNHRGDVVALDGEVSNSTFAEIFGKAHPERFVEMYMETHAEDTRFGGTGTQAAAQWLVSLVAPSEDEGRGSEVEDTPALLSDFDQGLWAGFMTAIQPQLKAMLTLAKNPASIAELFCETVQELARKCEK